MIRDVSFLIKCSFMAQVWYRYNTEGTKAKYHTTIIIQFHKVSTIMNKKRIRGLDGFFQNGLNRLSPKIRFVRQGRMGTRFFWVLSLGMNLIKPLWEVTIDSYKFLETIEHFYFLGFSFFAPFLYQGSLFISMQLISRLTRSNIF